MAYKDCLTSISEAAGRTFSDDELLELYEELQRYTRKRRKANAGASEDVIVLGAADDLAADRAEEAKIAARNTALNMKAQLGAVDRVRSVFPDMPIEGLKSTLTGSMLARRGARKSAAAEQEQLQGNYIGGFTADMEAAGLWKPWVSGAFDRDIARALRALDEDAPEPRVPREAIEMAKVVHKWQEVSRTDANAAGAWIKKMPGYIVRQSHDQYSIGKSYDAWLDFIMPRLDLERTFDGDPSDEVLKGIWTNLASGVHLKTTPPESGGFQGPRNLARKLSAERVLHFKSADDWFDYNERFGTRSLREAVMSGLESNARTTGLMRVWGPNPESNFRSVIDEIMHGLDNPQERKALSEAADVSMWHGTLNHAMKAVDGSVNVPVNATAARWASGARSFQRMSKLGGAMISSFSDLGSYGSEMRYQGRTVLSGVGEAAAGLVKGRGSEERRQMLGMLGAFSDLMRGEVAARFSLADDGLPGWASKMQQQFFKWNGLSGWTDSVRASAMGAMSHRLALLRDQGWGAIDPDLRRTLDLYEIGEADWDAIRASQPFTVEENAYIVPEAIGNRAVADKFRSYLTDRTNILLNMPDAGTRAFMLRGTRPGTIDGELLRFMGEFKSFSVSFTQKSLGREVYGRGSNTLQEALRNGNGEMVGLAWLMVQMTALGYLAMVTKDLLKGKEPRDPLSPKTWVAAMVQGGGLGIYGDFLFGEFNRAGGGILSTIAGPTLSGIEDAHNLYNRMIRGDDMAAATFRFALQNTPFANLFYTRIAMDYLFLWSLQEWLNPGSLRRMEKRVERDNGQKFLIRPSRERVRVFE